jgi:hypothetical protein
MIKKVCSLNEKKQNTPTDILASKAAAIGVGYSEYKEGIPKINKIFFIL